MREIKTKINNFAEVGAEILTAYIEEILEHKDNVIFAVPGGRSVGGIFEQLSTKNLPWKKIHIFMVDERIVPLNDSESNFSIIKKYLIDILGDKLPSENVHPFIAKENKENFGIDEYEKELIKFGGKFDLILLSSGEDGHVGGIYPNHHSSDDDEEESEFFIAMTDSPKPPSKRMSSSKKLLLRASYCLLLFKGNSKKNAYKALQDKHISSEAMPAKAMTSIQNITILSDI